MTRHFAQIISDRVHTVFATAALAGDFAGDLLMVDVTDVDPRPVPGWLYRPGDDVLFVPPEPGADSESSVPPTPALKTRYTRREFVLRLGAEYAKIERLRDENNTKPPHEKNYDLARLFRLYDEAEFIALNDPSLQQALQAFVGLGLVSEERAAEILTPNEVE